MPLTQNAPAAELDEKKHYSLIANLFDDAHFYSAAPKNTNKTIHHDANNDDDTYAEQNQVVDLADPDSEIAISNNNTKNYRQEFLIAQTQANNSMAELTRTTNRLDRANLVIANQKNRINELCKQVSTLDARRITLEANVKDAAKFVTAEYEQKLEAEKCITAGHKMECENLRHQIHTAKEVDKIFNRELVDRFSKMIRELVDEQKDSDKKLMEGIGAGKNQNVATTAAKIPPATPAHINNNNNTNKPPFRVSTAISNTVTVVKNFIAPPTPATSSAGATIKNRINDQLKIIRAVAQKHALAQSRTHLLERAFQLGVEEATARINSTFNQPNNGGYYNNNYYSGFKGGVILRNECLFSGASAVEKSFFLKCPDHQFAQLIDPKTGKLNETLFSFTFHGCRGGPTPTKNIMCEGYSASFHAGQAAGRGSYCGHGPNGFVTALGYSQTNVIINLVFKPPISDVDGTIHKKLDPKKYNQGAKFFGPVAVYDGFMVIDNPENRKDGTYMLPLGQIINKQAIINQRIDNATTEPDAVKRCLARSCPCTTQQKNDARILSDSPSSATTTSDNLNKEIYFAPAHTAQPSRLTSECRIPAAIADPLLAIIYPSFGNARRQQTTNTNKNDDDEFDANCVREKIPPTSRYAPIFMKGVVYTVDLFNMKMTRLDNGEQFNLIVQTGGI